MKMRNFHQLKIIRREAKGATSVIPLKCRYSRKIKHKKRFNVKHFYNDA
jgi:hypothetical protein